MTKKRAQQVKILMGVYAAAAAPFLAFAILSASWGFLQAG